MPCGGNKETLQHTRLPHFVLEKNRNTGRTTGDRQKNLLKIRKGGMARARFSPKVELPGHKRNGREPQGPAQKLDKMAPMTMKTGNRLSPTQPRSTASTLNPTAPPFRPNTSYHSHGNPPIKASPRIPNSRCQHQNNISSKALTVGHININRLRHKTNHIQESIDQYHLAILCISETWLDSNISDCEISIPGYRLLRTDRKSRKGGGVCIYIHSSLAANELHVKYPRDERQQAEAIFAEITLHKNFKVTVGCVYRPPDSGRDFWRQLQYITEPFVGRRLILERFCSTLSWRRNRTNVAFEARPRFSTLSWYVNHVTSGLATVSRRSPFFFSPWSFCG